MRSVIAMNIAEFQLQGLGDPRLAVHATSAQPAWLWSTDGTQDSVGQSGRRATVRRRQRRDAGEEECSARPIRTGGRSRSSPAACRQTAPCRLERLRGFGAAPGMLATCACSRLEFADGCHGVLITAVGSRPAAPCRWSSGCSAWSQDVESPIAAFARDGMFIGASDAARPLLGFRNLSEAGLDEARDRCLEARAASRPRSASAIMVLQRVGSGADIGLVALISRRHGGGSRAACCAAVAGSGAATNKPNRPPAAMHPIARIRNAGANRAKRRPNSRCSTNSPNPPRAIGRAGDGHAAPKAYIRPTPSRPSLRSRNGTVEHRAETRKTKCDPEIASG